MSPKTENTTGFAFEPLYLTDEAGRQIFVGVFKATFIVEELSRLVLAGEQVPVNLAGQYWGEPGESSWKYEPEIAFVKPATDVVLIGSAFPPYRGATEVDVRLRVGRVSKDVRVFGDRYWEKTFGFVSMSTPEPFDTVPLIYERAFGGSEAVPADGKAYIRYAANPVGAGLVPVRNDPGGIMKLPNLEDPRNLIGSVGDRPQPAAFGYVSPDWQPRASLGGTYDDQWFEERMPMLPLDFDRRFFNSASNGLTYPGFLRGDEPVLVENVTAEGAICLDLPGLPSPGCLLEMVGGKTVELTTQLDTLIVNTDDRLLFLIWRGHIPLENGPFDVSSIRAVAAHTGTERSHLYA